MARRPLPEFTLVFLVLAACSTPVDSGSAVSVTIEPDEVELFRGESEEFVATVEGSDDTAVTWSVTGGTFTAGSGPSMQWTAPATAGEYEITATSREDPSRSATAIARVVERPAGAGYSFDSYRGTTTTLPAPFFVTGENGAGLSVGGAAYDPFTGVSRTSSNPADSFDGFGAFTSDGETFSFGIRESGEIDLREARLFLRYVNDTDQAIGAFDVRYEVQVWRLGERANRIRLKYHTEPSGFSDIADIVSTTNPRGAARSDSIGVVVDGTSPGNQTTVSVKVDLAQLIGPEGTTYGSLAPGDTAYFRWQYSNADGDLGEVRSALAIDDVQIEPIYTTSPPQPGPPLSFSHEPGFHAQAVQLELRSAVPNAKIYYTVDGSIPDSTKVMSDAEWEALPLATRQRTYVYQNPIDLAAVQNRRNEIALIPTNSGFTPGGYPPPWAPPSNEVQKGTVLRAVAIANGAVAATETRSYFIDPSGRGRYTLPVVSLATDRRNLFASDNGIYVPGSSGAPNYDQTGLEWERLGYLELFDTQGARPLAQAVGVRIHGGGTRQLPQKSLRLYARSEYGAGRMRYRFFPSKALDDFDKILLRNGGNDWWAGIIRDPVIHTLVQHLPFGTQHYQPSIVFINGEYWGLHALRDRLDAQHLETHYGVPADNVDMLEFNYQVEEKEPGDAAAYNQLLAGIRSGEIDTAAEFGRYVDLDGYFDYVIAQMYAGNTDWPQRNSLLWRYEGGDPGAEKGPRDGRWRWLMFDVDRSFGFHTSKHTDLVEYMFATEHPDWMDPSFDLFRGIMKIRELRDEFLQRIAVHLATTFNENRVTSHIAAVAAGIEPEVAEHIARWGWPESVDAWHHHRGVMLDFGAGRPDFFRQHVIQQFPEIAGTASLEIRNLGGGRAVSLHTVDIAAATPGVSVADGRWSGRLFTGIPVHLRSAEVDLREAELSGGYVDLQRSADSIRFVLTGDLTLSLP